MITVISLLPYLNFTIIEHVSKYKNKLINIYNNIITCAFNVNNLISKFVENFTLHVFPHTTW